MVSPVVSFLVASACIPTAIADDKDAPLPDKAEIAKLITAYLKSPFAERGRFVVDPVIFEKASEAYYKKRSQPKIDLNVEIASAKKGPRPGYLSVVAKLTAPVFGVMRSETEEYQLVQTKDGLKFDWAANVGFNPIAFRAWAAGEDKLLTMRVTAQLDDYYNYHYRDGKPFFYSIACHERFGSRSELIHGYAAKGSDTGKSVLELLKDGQEHKVTLTFVRTGTETSVLGIAKLVSDSWVYGPDDLVDTQAKSARQKRELDSAAETKEKEEQAMDAAERQKRVEAVEKAKAEAKKRKDDEAAKPLEGIEVISVAGNGPRARAFVRLLPSKRTQFVKAGDRVGQWEIVSVDRDAESIVAKTPKGERKRFTKGE